MSGHLYIDCQRNKKTFALVYYYGHNETIFALQQTGGLIDYIYDHYENDYRLSIIRFIERFGGSVGSGANNRDYVKTLFPDKEFSHGSHDNGLVILEPKLIDTLKSQYSYTQAKHVVIDFNNDEIDWDVFRYWDDMNTFMNDATAESLYTDNPAYNASYYNKPINVIPFENIGIIDNLFRNSTIILDRSKAIFTAIL